MIRELIEYFVKTIVSHPEQVIIAETSSQERKSIGITVSQEDRGRVIGKDGKNIRAIRQCVEAVFPEAQHVFIDLAPQQKDA